LVLAGSAPAQVVSGIHVLNDEPIAPRGGVMMLELGAQLHGPGWPQALDVEFADGGLAAGTVVWLHRPGPSPELHWTTPAEGFAVRLIEPADDSSTGLGRPLLLIDVPNDATGTMRLLGRSLFPQYIDLPPADWGNQVLSHHLAHDRPDPESPFEHWRWVLLANRFNMQAPDPVGTEVEQRVARYHADLWRIGVGRLASVDEHAATECVDLLTATCMDHETSVAAWITDAGDIRDLLAMLLDPARSDAQVADDARAWAVAQEPLFFWVERDRGPQVSLAMVNPTRQDRLVTFRWVYGDRALDAAEIPIMVELAPERVTHVAIDRAEPADLGAQGLREPQLLIESGDFSRRFQLRPRVQPVAPPGLKFGVLFTTMTLAHVRSCETPAPGSASATTAEIRRRDGRWEVFFTCFRPDGAPAHLTPESNPLGLVGSWDALPGNEAVTLLIGAEDAPRAVISVPETGRSRVWVGDAESDRLVVKQKSYSDRWFCQIALPDSWVGFPLEDTCLIGLVRTHEGHALMETGPNPAIPWRIDPGRVEVDLRAWLDLPGR